ncbi:MULTISPECIES: H-NS family nucleoid-associated regulatory protein [unclassified Paracoccus (in: a-proteobacteria)]|uniref:H-NS histone family protein n=1 Tax=unclassified Paracoccus (in: a-proteobacteria) TaxID=2688777 RepID=UPI001602EEE7|nr:MULTISPECIES: H-NS histone family protein [unclassified Paracoccus (in: a-proteobacteria)]MBB1492080.1 H-NS histone family protein [Paracoccus sp. MC1854]MBB1497966.1 H-NS histone family protein [Paracoccus sp. MC1862]QQO44350.1 H-NS histone family protein [Paracoccus sp. MC1862]
MELDVDSMSLEDLRALRTQIDKAISSYETRRRKEAMAALERTARDMGFNLSELTGAGGRGRRGAAAANEGQPKYAHPDDPNQTWSGRGRRPRWVIEQIEAGRSLEDLLA